jgi:hypothetical protein
MFILKAALLPDEEKERQGIFDDFFLYISFAKNASSRYVQHTLFNQV